MRAIILVTMMFLIMPLWIQAAEVDSLYEAQVNVSSRAEEERRIAVQAALQQVLLKVVGNRQALAQTSLTPILNEATQLVQQFRYYAPEKEGGTATLWVRFDPSGVDHILRQQMLPVWGGMRPTVLAWVAIEEGMRRYLLDASMTSSATDILKEQARARGIPIIFPLWDLEDQSRLAFADVWGNFSDPLLAASGRYPAAVQLIGRLWRRQAGDWQARWTLYGAGEAQEWVATGGMEQVLRAGINGTVDIIATQIVPLKGDASGSSVQITVANVASFRDYARLSSYLNSLSQVTDMQPVQLSPTEARFKLELLGNSKGLIASIQLGRVLVQVEKAELLESSTPNTGLNYRLLP